MPLPKILIFDVESTSLDADRGYTLCIAYQELGKATKVLSIADYELHDEEPWNDSKLLADFYNVIEDADIVISYYGKGFDWGFLNGRLLFNGMAPLPETLASTNHIDLYFTARRTLRLSSRSMGNVAELAELEDRKFHLPKKTWIKAQAGHVPSIREIGRYCRKDVEVLKGAYLKMRGLVRLHPNVGEDTLDECRFCGSDHLQRRGYQLTTGKKKQRVQCQDCGAWDTRAVSAEDDDDAE